jgi:hypothetical protein
MNSFPGDYFLLEHLILSRPAIGYAVQYLGTDRVLNDDGLELHPIRNANKDRVIFNTFEMATTAGLTFLAQHPDSPLSIVPIGYDPVFERLVLIQGVIQP